MAAGLSLVASSLARVGRVLAGLAQRTLSTGDLEPSRPLARGPSQPAGQRSTSDRIALNLYGLNIHVNRDVPLEIPYEITVVVPRAEIRLQETRFSRRAEIILNSVTIAHSPRPPTSGSRASS